MTATETQGQKPKTSRVAIAAFVFSVIGIVVLFAPRIPFGPKVSLCLVAFGIGFIVGIAALVKMRFRNLRAVGGSYAISAIALGLLYAGMGMNNTARFYDSMYKYKLTVLGRAINEYCKNHDGRFPPAEQWCDSMTKDNRALSRSSFRNPFTGYCFAFNKNLNGLRIADIPENVVLLFPGNGGRNMTGGPELFARIEPLLTYVLLTNGEVCEYSWFDKGVIRWNSTSKKTFIEPLRWNP
jgi:hypothetical protein